MVCSEGSITYFKILIFSEHLCLWNGGGRPAFLELKC